MTEVASGHPAQAGKAYYLPVGLHPRLKAAWWATRGQEDSAPTLGLLVTQAFDRAVIQLQNEHNAGAPFPPGSATLRHRGGRGDHESRSYFLPVSTHQRLVDAWAATRTTAAGAPSVSNLAARILAAEAERLERTHNSGAPFEPAPRGARGVNPAAARRQSEAMSEAWRRRRSSSPE